MAMRSKSGTTRRKWRRSDWDNLAGSFFLSLLGLGVLWFLGVAAYQGWKENPIAVYCIVATVLIALVIAVVYTWRERRER